MARRRRVDSNEQPCRCQECLKHNPEGLLLPRSILNTHRHRERLRAALSTSDDHSEVNRTDDPINPDSIASGSLQPDPQPHIRAPSPPPPPIMEVEDYEDWLRSIVSEIGIRLKFLYDSETHLEFVNHPSPNLSFVSPDPEALLQVNSGDFCLKTTSSCNMRFLETETRFCGLLHQIQALPLGARLRGDLDVENELYTALDRVHPFKGRQWNLQAYPNGLGGVTVNNTTRCLSAEDEWDSSEVINNTAVTPLVPGER
ncbi:uncharacterized protein C8R40DRAFT_1175994 [Lentinula edodes]|uniref:uncharacterized protein n=1 Tax=Lentinula edodes TaxID=5353 RepID=UPI001E8D9F9B|nr:uncharacterized protein C8R40DRAFT_1175994 [Lentinula edodes]KAH7870083.1 hypothetical protein C8R40DRAFT_1175994 [Lentinula edodes]